MYRGLSPFPVGVSRGEGREDDDGHNEYPSVDNTPILTNLRHPQHFLQDYTNTPNEYSLKYLYIKNLDPTRTRILCPCVVLLVKRIVILLVYPETEVSGGV